jgi:hypothetical protein
MDKWIQDIKFKKGTLHRQLNIQKDKKIPMGLLNKIIKSKAGDTIRNDGEKIKVTRLLERRAILAKNLKNIKR